MPRPQQLGEMNIARAEALRTEIKPLKKEIRRDCIKTRVTFPFPISREKHELLDTIADDQPIDLKLFNKLLQSTDVVERGIAYGLAPQLNANDLTTEQIRCIIKAYRESVSFINPADPIRSLSGNPFPKFSETQIPTLMELIAEDGFLSVPVIQALGDIGQPALPALRQIANQGDKNDQVYLAQAFSHCGDEAFEDLKLIYESKLYNIQFDAALALIRSGEQGTQFIINEIRLKENLSLYINIFYFFTVKEAGPLSLLKFFLDHPSGKDANLQKDVAHALPKYGIDGLKFIEGELNQLSTEAKIELILVIENNFGKDGYTILEKLSEDSTEWVRSVARTRLNKLRLTERPTSESNKTETWIPEIAGSSKAVFATPEARRAMETLKILRDITETLIKYRKSYQLTGLVIFGSLSKGYLSKESDIDYGVITRGKDPTKEVDDHLIERGLKPCTGNKYVFDSNLDKTQPPGLLSMAFYGLFIGDEKKLAETQVAILESIRPATWDEIRLRIFREETNVEKAGERYGLTKKEIEKTQLAALITRVPPDYKTSLELARKRLRAVLKKI